ncbi:MAG: hypothetical protein K0U41_02370 [Gammaproteobacteria bacterium]|nr:hypothetical protein [Gammaproteobacteria bacterium]
MGTTTKAILCWGVNLGEELPAWAEDFSFEEWILEESGFPEWTKDSSDNYFEERNKILEEYPVTLVKHCCEGYPMYILAVPGTVITANRGYPEEIHPDTMPSVSAKQRMDLINWSKEHGVTLPDEPKWLLCSYWSG